MPRTYADRSQLRIERQALPMKGGVVFGDTKSAGRTVKLDPITIAALENHRDAEMLERQMASSAYEDSDLIFCDEIGRVLNPKRVTDAFAQHRKDAGIAEGSLHVLRHTCATLSLSKGIDPTTVARRLGDDEVTVLTAYSHLVPCADERAAEVRADVADKALTNEPLHA